MISRHLRPREYFLNVIRISRPNSSYHHWGEVVTKENRTNEMGVEGGINNDMRGVDIKRGAAYPTKKHTTRKHTVLVLGRFNWIPSLFRNFWVPVVWFHF